MDRAILKRIEALEAKRPGELIVYAVTTDGREVTTPFREVVTEEGKLRPGFAMLGRLEGGQIIKDGDNLREFDELLDFILPEGIKAL